MEYTFSIPGYSMMLNGEVPPIAKEMIKSLEEYLKIKLEDEGRLVNTWLFENSRADVSVALLEPIDPVKRLEITIRYPENCGELPESLINRLSLKVA